MRVTAWLFGVLLSILGSVVGAETLSYTTYYHNDHLGSPVAATNEQGALLWRAHFRPYGERQEDPKEISFGSVGYTGHIQDADSGMVYAGARYYDPLIGRFMAIDPAAVQSSAAGTFNRYSYAADNPYRYNDPSGQIPIDTLWDVANVAYDLGKATVGAATGNSAMVAEGMSDAALDAGAMLVPYMPAGGSKLARKGLGEAAEETNSAKGADFIVGGTEVAIPTSKSRLEQGFKDSGFASYSNQKTAEAGTIYVDPKGGNLYRVMEGSSAHPPRLMTHAPKGNPLLPDGRNIPGGLSKNQVRDLTHFTLKP